MSRDHRKPNKPIKQIKENDLVLKLEDGTVINLLELLLLDSDFDRKKSADRKVA